MDGTIGPTNERTHKRSTKRKSCAHRFIQFAVAHNDCSCIVYPTYPLIVWLPLKAFDKIRQSAINRLKPDIESIMCVCVAAQQRCGLWLGFSMRVASLWQTQCLCSANGRGYVRFMRKPLGCWWCVVSVELTAPAKVPSRWRDTAQEKKKGSETKSGRRWCLLSFAVRFNAKTHSPVMNTEINENVAEIFAFGTAAHWKWKQKADKKEQKQNQEQKKKNKRSRLRQATDCWFFLFSPQCH